MSVVSLSEDQVKPLLDWPLACDAAEQAFRSLSEVRLSDDQPTSKVPLRSYGVIERGRLKCMPGFIGNYKLKTINETKVFNTLGCKLSTSFPDNVKLQPPKPNILANILLMNDNTGELKAIVQGTEITAWRTAAATIIATKFLYSSRPSSPIIDTLAILGCGVQGRIHAIGFCVTNPINTIRLWNRTEGRAEMIAAELNQLRSTFKNPNVKIVYSNSIEECVRNADVINTCTFSPSPLVTRSMIKDNVLLNAVGWCCKVHFSEVCKDIYLDPKAKVYVGDQAASETEFKNQGVKVPIVGQIGDVINGIISVPTDNELSIFYSMGIATHDITLTEAVIYKFQHQNE